MSATYGSSGASILGLTAAQLTFDDEFDTFTSSTNGYYGWGTQYPYSGQSARNFGNGSLNYDSDSSVGVDPFSDQNGVLTITAAKATTPLPYGLTYTSGVITSRYLASQQYGYYEAGINVPTPTGLWPSFYLLANNNTFPSELDIAEVLSKNNKQVYNVTHYVTPAGAAKASLNVAAVPDLSVGFHTVGADWEPDKITWYVDGVVTTVQQTPFGFDQPMYMVLTLALGGSFPGYPTADFTSAGYQVDYVRAYATAATGNVSGSNVIKASSIAGLVANAAGGALAGVTVSLVDALNQVIGTLATDINGYFIFTNLAAGNYRVLYSAGAGLVPATGGLADPVSGLTAVTTLGAGVSKTLATETFGPATLSAVTGKVLFAAAAGGAGTAQSGVVVTLVTTAGAVLSSTVTTATGDYLFTNLAAGSYKVTYTALAHDVLVPGGPADSATGTTATFTTLAGQTTTLAPETITPGPGTVSGTVVYSGKHSEGWVGTGEGGVTVQVVTLGGAVVGSAVTASDGTYAIAGVTAGYYYVQVTPPSGQVVANGFGSDVSTNRTARIQAAPARGTVAPTVTLIDAGAPSITGSVLFGAPGITPAPNPNVAVALLERKGTTVIATTTTGLDGKYTFANMEPGAYFVRFSLPTGETLQSGGPANSSGVVSFTLPSTGLAIAPVTLLGTTGRVNGTVLYAATGTDGSPEAGVTVQLLDAAHNVVQSKATDASGNYSFLSIIPGTYSLQFTAPSGQRFAAGGPAFNSGGTLSFGVASGQVIAEATELLIPLAGGVGGSVQFAGSGQAGVTVSLIASDGSTAATTTTTSTGAFVLRYIAPGSYQLLYTPPAGEVPLPGGPANPGTGLTGPITVVSNQTLAVATETLALAGTLAGRVLQAAGGGAAGAAVSVLAANGSTVLSTTAAADGSFSVRVAAGSYRLLYAAPTGEMLQAGPADPQTGLTGMLTITAGQTLTLADEVVGTGAPVLGGISGSALFAGAGQAGVGVALLSADASATLASTTTNAAGAFSFAGLAAGTYQLRYTAPSGEVLQSGPASAATGLTGPLMLAAGQTLALAAEALAAAPATLSGSALFAGAGQAGVGVALLSADASATLASTTTNAAGAFSFAGLAAGTYQLRYTAPSGEVLQSGPASAATGLTGPLTLAAGQTLALAAEALAAAPATLSGSALFAGAGQAGVGVALLSADASATLASTTTNAGGAFSFAGLAAGTYQLRYTAPSGEVLQSGPGSAATGLTGPLTLAAGQTLALAAEALAPAPGTITGRTLFAGAGQAGVTIALLSPDAATTYATTTTNAGGYYAFTGLAVGYYRVRYVPPAGELIQGGPADPVTGLTMAFGVTAGVTRTMGPVGLAPAYANLAGSVLFAGAGQPGVAVALRGSDGTVLATTTSDANGAFAFTQLRPGSYTLAYTAPAGEVFQPGDPADPASGLTGPITLVAGQSATAAPEHLLLAPVSLVVNGSAQTLTRGNGTFIVTGNPTSSTVTLGNGDQTVTLGGFYDTVTLGNGNDTVTLNGAGQVLHVGDGRQALTLTGNFDTVTLGNTPAGQTSTVAVRGNGATVTGGDGNVIVTGPTGGSTVTLGNGNQSVTLTGAHNTVTLGTGTSAVDAGVNSAVVRGTGGIVGVKVAGQSNLVDIGPGTTTIEAGAARLDTFVLNGAGAGLTTITGFNPSAGNVLDLTRTLAGTTVAHDLSNVGAYVTAVASGGSTTLLVDPTGGSGTPYAFAVLQNVTTSVGALLAQRDFRLS